MEKLTSELFREFMRLAFASEDFVGIVKQIHGSIGCEAPTDVPDSSAGVDCLLKCRRSEPLSAGIG